MSLLLAALLSSTAVLDIEVPGDFLTIQGAVDAAAPGDVVIVSSGTYVENVVITTEGITLAGKKVTIDGEFAGPCVRIEADDVTLDGLTLRNGGDILTNTDSLSVIGDGLTLRDCTLLSGAGIGVRVDGGDVTIEKTEIAGMKGAAVRIFSTEDASSSRIEKVDIVGCGRGIVGIGGAYRVFNTTIERVNGIGIEVETSANNVATQIRSNRLTGIGGDGISVTADKGGFTELLFNHLEVVDGVGILVEAFDGDVDVVKSRITSTRGDGIHVSSNDQFFIADNRVDAAVGDAIVADAAGSEGGLLEGNRVADSGGRGYVTSGFGIVLRSNRAQDTVGAGILHDGLGATVTGNKIDRAGRQGLRFTGNGGLIENNKIKGSALDGILFSGSTNQVVGNKVTDNGGDGIDLHEFVFFLTNSNNSIVDNLTKNNAHEGVDATGKDTVIDGNKVSGNGGVLGPQIAGAGNDIDGDDEPDGTVASFSGNQVGNGPQAPGGLFTGQRLDVGEQ